MKRSRMIAVLGFMALTVTLVSQAQKEPNGASASKSISASGYVTAGVEAGCLMLQDSKTKTLYNLLFAGGNKPALGTAIQFTGTRHDGPTTCMQGQAVDVKRWTPARRTAPDATRD